MHLFQKDWLSLEGAQFGYPYSSISVLKFIASEKL